MPLHKWPPTKRDFLSLITAFIFFYQPFVDRKAVMQAINTSVFGSREFTALYGMIIWHKLLEWGCIAFYYLWYTLEWAYYEKVKIAPKRKWPWDSKNEEERQEYRDLQWRAFWYIVKFHLVVIGITVLSGLINTYKGTVDVAPVDPETIPPWWVCMYQILITNVVAEIGFYFGHRLLHTKYLYFAHKIHHQFVDSTVLATFFVHPIEAMICDVLPIAICVIGFKMHFYTLAQLSFAMILPPCYVHCGYDTVLGFNPLAVIPFATGGEEIHDLHHRLSNKNFGGQFFVLDRLFGTYVDPTDVTVNEKGVVIFKKPQKSQ